MPATTNAPLKTANTANAAEQGAMISERFRTARSSVSRISAVSPCAACREKVGNNTVINAVPNMPSGK